MEHLVAMDAAQLARRRARTWALCALAGSLLIHLTLVLIFRQTHLQQFSIKPQERLAPRPVTVERVEIDPALLEEPAQSPEASSPKKQDSIPDIILPEEQPQFEQMLSRDIRATPAAADLAEALLKEQPEPQAETAVLAERMSEQSARDLEKSLAAMTKSLSANQPIIQPGSLIKGSSEDLTRSAAALAAEGGGYSDLDGLLAQSGNLKAGTAPILMPTDLLFNFDSAEMRPGAEQSLAKLGRLIARNPKILFVIEGHSDSFGSPEYNLELSRARAETVKRTVVALTGVSARQIQTVGYGSSRLIAPASGSMEEQQINRRVEIVIKAQ